MNSKHWYQSKLTWLGILTTVIAIAEYLSQSVPAWSSVLTGVVGVGNIVLRVYFTNTVIKGTAN